MSCSRRSGRRARTSATCAGNQPSEARGTFTHGWGNTLTGHSARNVGSSECDRPEGLACRTNNERKFMSILTFKSTIDVSLVQSMGGDHMVVAAAKVSTCGEAARAFADPEAAEGNAGLINYLMKHRHGTPFEHGAATFYVHAPIFVWREWHRHRIGFSYNEESGRYKQLEPVFYLPDRERPMMKVDGWKPGRPKFLRCEDEKVFCDLINNLRWSYSTSYRAYEDNLALGIDPGLARDCLPVGIYSGCWVTCNPRSLMAFLSLRTHDPEAKAVSYPLHEIELAARACEAMFSQGWPLSYRAFCENGRQAP
jgi:thymidylate synthase (FAD)